MRSPTSVLADNTENTLGRVHADDVEFMRQSIRQLQVSLMTGLIGPESDATSNSESATKEADGRGHRSVDVGVGGVAAVEDGAGARVWGRRSRCAAPLRPVAGRR